MKVSRFDLQPGRTLGPNYFIVEFLGGGWEGEVYKVEERRTKIIRAAKLFYFRKKTREAPLLRYAKKLHKLKTCPIVVQYHHRGIARVGKEQIEFLVSDMADGQMLSSFLETQKKKRLSEFEALHLFYALVVGVEAIHYLGEYHGDIHSDNIIVNRRGLGFDVRLLDFFDLGRSNQTKIQYDIYDMIALLYEMIGGEAGGYPKASKVLKKIIMGRKHSLISKKFKTAGQLRIALENINWE